MSLPLIVGLVGTFLAVGLATGVVVYMTLVWRAPARKRLMLPGMTGALVPAVAGAAPLVDQPSMMVRRVASVVPKSPKDLGKLRRRLVRAGYQSPSAALLFSLSELVLPVIIGAIPIILLGWRQGAPFSVVGALVGYVVPGVVLGRMIEVRRKAISDGLPDALDLLIVCLEAGCGLDQALAKTADELSVAHPALGEELKMLNVETRAGKPRIEAFKNFEARTKNEDVRALVAMLIQTDRFGTSVSQALRTFAEVSRTKRRQRAEEAAAKIGVKLVFPLILCLMPALFVAIAASAVIQIVHVLFGQILK